MNAVAPQGSFVECADGLRVHYHERGTGSPVVFIHGGGPGATGYSNFDANMRALEKHGYRAIAVDLLGFGDSSQPDIRYSYKVYANTLERLADGLGLEKMVLVGNSLGGGTALQYTLDHPERVEKLVLMAPGGLASRVRYAMMPGIRAMFWAMLAPGGPNEERIRDVIQKQVWDSSLVTDALVRQRLGSALKQSKAAFRGPRLADFSSRLSEIRVPTLVLWGTVDRFCPFEHASKLVSNIPVCRLVALSQCGHWVQVERSDVFDRELASFLLEGRAASA
ncbi:alpha/beta fold hydrolase [Pyxidicoccus sp. MSG2]|uniref:alpha/beta fold hydrolase n=1 Tax=Pyxidicoccus sp. MSG2 TaxID=2996790 RepID=UPI00226F47EC|nr:alpha/beta hydrolase [Pyxidicoccus sp. MSG2]MCY1021661.1 alpha/beta hydrolase [Pyxidicoccus sp. MSG2]